MQLKTINLKSTIKTALFCCFVVLLNLNIISAQEIIEDQITDLKSKRDTLQQSNRMKVDGVAAVVGDYIVLDSDIDKEFLQLQTILHVANFLENN